MGRFHRDPDACLALMREEVPDYERLHLETAAATGTSARRALELGTGRRDGAGKAGLFRRVAATWRRAAGS